MIGIAILGLGLVAFLNSSNKGKFAQITQSPAIGMEDAMLAADQLAQYLRNNAPGKRKRMVISEYQKRMGGISVDGIYGSQTRSRMEYLIQRRLEDAQKRISNV